MTGCRRIETRVDSTEQDLQVRCNHIAHTPRRRPQELMPLESRRHSSLILQADRVSEPLGVQYSLEVQGCRFHPRHRRSGGQPQVRRASEQSPAQSDCRMPVPPSENWSRAARDGRLSAFHSSKSWVPPLTPGRRCHRFTSSARLACTRDLIVRAPRGARGCSTWNALRRGSMSGFMSAVPERSGQLSSSDSLAAIQAPANPTEADCASSRGSMSGSLSAAPSQRGRPSSADFLAAAQGSANPIEAACASSRGSMSGSLSAVPS